MLPALWQRVCRGRGVVYHPQRARVHQVLGRLCVQPAVLLRHLSLPIARARGHGLGVGRPLTVHNVIYIFILSIYKTKFCPVSPINPVFFQRKFFNLLPLATSESPEPTTRSIIMSQSRDRWEPISDII